MKDLKLKLELYSIIIGYTLFVMAIFYIAIASSIWEYRNPKANRMTVLTHFGDVIKLKKLEKFQ